MPLPIRISLAAARVNAKMTQRELANKMDVSVNTIISWEKGKVIPNKAQLHFFCDICNIPEDNIFLQKNFTKCE